jgi:redox-sensitive bicupin YhaK (pirin superfamily)
MTIAPVVDIRRAADRFATQISWLDSKHSFSFGHHYDPDNTHHGLLLVNNDDIVQPGTGFETHPHRDMEIVTWVLRGSLVHQDSTGHSGVIYPGLAQRMSAGTGILHSEKNDSWRLTRVKADSGSSRETLIATEPVHFIQMWVVPDEAGITPGYQQLEIDDELLSGGLVTIASGMPQHRDQSAISIRNRYAALHGARLRAGQSTELPPAPYLHLFIARGAVTLEGAGRLGEGDAARLTGSGGQRVSATEPSEILVWEMHAELAA